MKFLALTTAASVFALAACASNGYGDTDTGDVDNAKLDAVLSDARRDNDRARDIYRHPKDTLSFFRLSPDMTVVEMAPGGGWYTRILAPYVAEEGGYIAGNYHPDTFGERARESLGNWPNAFPDRVAAWAPDLEIDTFSYQTGQSAAFEGEADAVLYFRALHGLAGQDRLSDVLDETYAMLKPGGIVGVVQHRAKEDAPDAYANGDNGYMKQSDVIARFEAKGFDFVSSAEINANPNDPANWEGGVWTLPPANRGPEERRQEFLAIGESDRMTLLFRKPA